MFGSGSKEGVDVLLRLEVALSEEGKDLSSMCSDRFH
jgi:hypothetical protein